MSTFVPSQLELERRAYRRGRQLRSVLIAAASTLAFAVIVWITVINTEGWATVQRTFFDPEIALQALPKVWHGFLLNLQVLAISLFTVGLSALALSACGELSEDSGLGAAEEATVCMVADGEGFEDLTDVIDSNNYEGEPIRAKEQWGEQTGEGNGDARPPREELGDVVSAAPVRRARGRHGHEDDVVGCRRQRRRRGDRERGAQGPGEGGPPLLLEGADRARRHTRELDGGVHPQPAVERARRAGRRRLGRQRPPALAAQHDVRRVAAGAPDGQQQRQRAAERIAHGFGEGRHPSTLARRRRP